MFEKKFLPYIIFGILSILGLIAYIALIQNSATNAEIIYLSIGLIGGIIGIIVVALTIRKGKK